jgi:maltose O-acetyltransferase
MIDRSTAARQRDRMLQGLLYDAMDPELVAERRRARRLLERFNGAPADDEATREDALAALLGHVGARVRIEPPFRCDYGTHVSLGDDVYFNFNAVILDCAPVRVGDRVLCGPNVQLLAATHPLDSAERAAGLEYALPITIDDDAWIGGGVIVGPGVTVGARSVIGAGSVVVRDVPADVVAVGNPCRIVRELR